MTKEFSPFFAKHFAPTLMQSKKALECILHKKKAMTSDIAKRKPKNIRIFNPDRIVFIYE